MPRTPQRSERSTEATVNLPPRVDALPPARMHFAEWLRANGVDGSTADDLEVVFSELTANAVTASPDESAAVRIHAFLEQDAVVLEVSNRTDGTSTPHSRSGRSTLSASGRGLVIARSFVDQLDVVQDAPDRVTVRARRRIARSG